MQLKQGLNDLRGKVERMEGNMTEVKKYLDTEKELMPVLIRAPVEATKSLQVPPPCAPTIVSAGPVPLNSIRVNPVLPMINTIQLPPTTTLKIVPNLSSPLANTPPQIRPIVPLNTVTASSPRPCRIAPKPATVSLDCDDDLFDENVQIVEELDPLLGKPAHTEHVEVINESHPPMELKNEEEIVLEETEVMDEKTKQFIDNFYIKDLQDFKRKCEQLEESSVLRAQLQKYFKEGATDRSENFELYFSDEFLNEITWLNGFKGSSISNILQTACWAKTDHVEYATFIKRQVSLARARMVLKHLEEAENEEIETDGEDDKVPTKRRKKASRVFPKFPLKSQKELDDLINNLDKYDLVRTT